MCFSVREAAQELNHLLTVQQAGGRGASGAHLPADSHIRLHDAPPSAASIPPGQPSPCRCTGREAVMNHSRFNIGFLQKASGRGSWIRTRAL